MYISFIVVKHNGIFTGTMAKLKKAKNVAISTNALHSGGYLYETIVTCYSPEARKFVLGVITELDNIEVTLRS